MARYAIGFINQAEPNNGMHPTADTASFINLNLWWRRVMPGVRAHQIRISSYAKAIE